MSHSDHPLLEGERHVKSTTLLIHSSGLSSRQWGKLMALLPGPCVAPDLCGYPEGPHWDGVSALERDLEHLVDLLDQIEGPVDVVGHSYGGSLAFRLALERPKRIRRLVAHEPVLWGVLISDGPAELVSAVDVFAESGFIGVEDGGGPRWIEAFVDYWNVPGAWKSMPTHHQAAFLSMGKKVFCEVRDLFHERSPAELYDALDFPTLITTGEDTTPEEAAVCEALVARLPSRALRRFKGGHMVPLSHAAHFNEVVVAFLTEGSVD